MLKKVVKYRYCTEDHDQHVKVGQRAIIMPLDHESPLVSNTTAALTSPVIRVFTEIVGFETANTIYVKEVQ